MPPTLSPTAAVPLPAVRCITWLQPLEWLALAWRDICRVPTWSLLQGLALALLGGALLVLGHNRFAWMAGALSGFLVVGPVLATSWYAMSRGLERGEVVDLQLLLRTWLRWQQAHPQRRASDYWCLVQFGALLALAAAGWMAVSAALLTLLSPVRIATPLDFLQHVVAASDAQLFTLWMALGSVLAAPIFASSVVAMPLLLDRRVDVWQAVLTSWSVVLVNPIPMALWAAVIVLLTLLGLASLMLGLVLVLPMLGHASWHAYRDVVDATEYSVSCSA